MNPLRYVSPEMLASITKVVGLCAAAAAPSAMLSQQTAQKAEHRAEESDDRLGYANANTNAALGIVAVLSARLDSTRAEVRELRAQYQLKERAAVASLPQFAVGPPVPIKKHWWQR